jgi:hypothetical protein
MTAAADRNRTEDPGRELAQWLLEAGRRRPARQLNLAFEAGGRGPDGTRAPAAAARRLLVKQTIMLTALVAAYLQYFYINVLLQIASLPTVVIFTATQGF